MNTDLSSEQFRQLSVLSNTGIAPDRAIAALESGSKSQSFLPVKNKLKNGSTLGDALSSGDFLSRYETLLIKIGEKSGKVSEVLKFIATSRESRETRLGKLKAQIWLPVAVALIAAFAGLVLKIAGGAPVVGSTISTMIMLALFAVATKALLKILQLDALTWLSLGWSCGLQKYSALYQRYFEQYFFRAHLWQSDAGIDVATALHTSTHLLSNRSFQSNVKSARKQTEQGQSFVTVLRQNALIFSDDLRQILVTAEHAGNLEQSLQTYLAQKQPQLRSTTDSIYVWLPRLYYAVVILIFVPIFF